jgi:hypothetical protein
MRCLMLAIADLANDDGVAWPGTAKLAEKINETDDYTDVLIKKCIETGELVKISGRGRGHKTRFAILCGLDPSAQKELKGALQNPYSSAPFKRKGVPQKGVLPSEKRGTFRHAKEPPITAVQSAETASAENDILHDPESDLPPPPLPPTQNGGGGGVSIKEEPTETERYLLRERFGKKAAHDFRHFDLAACTCDIKESRAQGSGNGSIINRWYLEPPRPAPSPAASSLPAWRTDDAPPVAETIGALAALLPHRRKEPT